MIHLATLALTDWLADPDTGPNAHLPGVAREELDATLKVAPIKRVVDPFRDRAAMFNEEPGQYPVLYVSPASPVDVAGEVNQDEQDSDGLQLLVRLVVEAVPSPAALRAIAYTMTAINRAVSGFFAETDAARAARQRGHVQIIGCLGRSYALSLEDLGAAKVAGQMLITLSTRDIEAS